VNPRSPSRFLLVALVAAFLYLPTILFGFAYDDAIVVETHPQVTGHAWGAIAVSPYHVGQDVRVPTGAYRPLTIASLAANHLATGMRAWSYHLVNVLLHALVAVLVLALGEAIGLGSLAALAGALLFAVHPVHVEAVANVAGRAELLSTAPALAALLVYVRARNGGERMSGGAATAVAVLLGMAAFAKENVVTIVGVVAFWEFLRARSWRGSAIPLVAVAAPVALYIAARWGVLGGLGLAPGAVTPIENPIAGLTGLPRLATVLSVFGRAVSLVVTPVRLSPDYGFAEIVPSPSLLAPGPIVGVLLLAAMIAAIVATWRRAPLVGFLIASFLATYAIVSNAVILIGTVLGDRLLYLPSVFLCLLAGLGAGAAARRIGRPAAYAVLTIVLVLLAARSFSYAREWKDDATLFEYAARVAPNSVRCVGSWGAILAERGRLDEARPILDRAVALAPDFVPNRLNRGAAALAAGDLDAAEADARRVLELDPGNAVATAQMRAIETRRR
jgi:protein O-mannosyl-transferase